MSQANNPFTQAASQGYGDFEATQDDEEEQPDGPQSPEPEDEQSDSDPGFTQSQERSYPTGIDSAEEDAGPSSPAASESDDNEKQSPQRRRVQIMNDSDNEDDVKSTSAIPKETNRHFLKQFTKKSESPQKKRRSVEHQQEKNSKRLRTTSNDDVEATSDVEDVVDDIFGKGTDDNDEEADNDEQEVAAELAELNDTVEEQHDEEETYDDDGEQPDVQRQTSKNTSDFDIDSFLKSRSKGRGGYRGRGDKNDVTDLTGVDFDKVASDLIERMRIATEEDRIFNQNRQPATAKLLLLPIVERHLCRIDLADGFLDNGILSVFKDWLSPLPDKSLPNIKIRQSLINALPRFGLIDGDRLSDSGIGKALMYLYKHPRETKDNKIKLIKIIQDWARPIFDLQTDYNLLTREERQQRDADQASFKRQTSSTGKPKSRNADVDLPFANDSLDDNDDDDCPRARVPKRSNKDYVVRPVSKVETSNKKNDGGKKKSDSRLDEIKRQQQNRKRLTKPMPIVKLSIEGNKMHI